MQAVLGLVVVAAFVGMPGVLSEPPIEVAAAEPVVAASVDTGTACWESDDENGEGSDGLSALIMRAILQCGPELGLAEGQTRRLASIADGFLRETVDRQAQLRMMQLALVELLRPHPSDPGRPVDLAAAEQMIREIARVGADQDLALVRTIEQLKAVLTPEQRGSLATLLVVKPSPRTL
jgi:hypothetical protein